MLLVIDPCRLKAARLRLSLSREALGESSGVNRKTIERLELGRHPARVGTIQKLAAALGVKPTDIATIVEQDPH